MARFLLAAVTLVALLCAIVSAQNLLANPTMDGCEGSADPLLVWTGDFNAGDGTPLSYDPFAAGTIEVTGLENSCAAAISTDSSPYSQTVTFAPEQVGGTFDFEIYFTCSALVGKSGSCAFSVEVNDVLVNTLVGTTSKTAVDSGGEYTIVSFSQEITSTTVKIDLICDVVGPHDEIYCFLDDASLTFAGGGSGDPHFRGWNGQIFDFQGVPKQSYNLVSDVDLQVNVMLDAQHTGPHSLAAGAVMKIMALFTPEHTIIANAGGSFKEDLGFVTLDGVKIQEGQTIVTESGVSISFNKVDAKASQFGINSIDHVAFAAQIDFKGSYNFLIFFIENHFNPLDPEAPFDSLYYRRFIDFESSLLDSSRSPSGILGQTAHIRPEDKGRSLSDWKIQGSELDYQLKDGLMGKNFAFNKFAV